MEQKLIRSDKPFMPSPISLNAPSELFLSMEPQTALAALLRDWKSSTNMEAHQYPEFTIYLQAFQYCTV